MHIIEFEIPCLVKSALSSIYTKNIVQYPTSGNELKAKVSLGGAVSELLALNLSEIVSFVAPYSSLRQLQLLVFYC